MSMCWCCVVSGVHVPLVFHRYQFLLHYMFAVDYTKEINLLGLILMNFFGILETPGQFINTCKDN